MVPHGPEDPGAACHPETWELLPWRANGTLEGAERAAVDERLATCSSCRAELARCHELSAAVLTATEPQWSPSPADVARILARADAVPASGARARTWWARRRDGIVGGLSLLSAASPILRWGLVVESLLVVMLALVIVWQASPFAPRYQTLISNRGSDHGGAQIRVAFADDITERELRALLASVGGELVGGPSAMGVYTVQIGTVSADRVGEVLEQLRASGKVRLAEPALPR